MTAPDDIRKTILAALDRARGDDLERIERLFGSLTPVQMAMEHGCSGFTRQEVLNRYRSHATRVDAAKKWVEEHL